MHGRFADITRCCHLPIRFWWSSLDIVNAYTRRHVVVLETHADGTVRGIGNRKGAIMIEGTVKFFNTTKGFGFIQPNDGSKDAFVHISAVERSGLPGLSEGQRVSYDLEKGRDGKLSATNLRAL